MSENKTSKLALLNFEECVKHMKNSLELLKAGKNKEAFEEALAAKRFARTTAFLMEVYDATQ